MADSENEGVTDMRQWIKPTDFQKLVLVIGKAYKRKADIPDRVSQRQMTKAFDIFEAVRWLGCCCLDLRERMWQYCLVEIFVILETV
jgi:hypothetical protein